MFVLIHKTESNEAYRKGINWLTRQSETIFSKMDELKSSPSFPKRKRRRVDQTFQENTPKPNTRHQNSKSSLTHLMKEVIELKIENDEVRKAAERNCVKLSKISRQNRTYLERINELEDKTAEENDKDKSVERLKREFDEYKTVKEAEIEQLRLSHNNKMEVCWNEVTRHKQELTGAHAHNVQLEKSVATLQQQSYAHEWNARNFYAMLTKK